MPAICVSFETMVNEAKHNLSAGEDIMVYNIFILYDNSHKFDESPKKSPKCLYVLFRVEYRFLHFVFTDV